MKRLLSTLKLTAVCLMVQGCSYLKPINLLNAAIPEVGYTLSADIPYGPAPRQVLDIYIPDEAHTNSRLIVFVYGGAWRKGEKSQFEFVGQALSAAGHTVVIPDYRKYPKVTFPTVVTDVALAIDALPRLAELTGFPGREIVLMGHSSGAHTAALLAADPDFLAPSDVQVEALVALSGPYDLPMENPEVASVFADVSPDSVKIPRLVTRFHAPTLLAHGLDDERVDPRHTLRYQDALERHNVRVRVRLVEGAGHAGLLAGLAAPLRFTSTLLDDILEFLAGGTSESGQASDV